jgi:hypothetical protein
MIELRRCGHHLVSGSSSVYIFNLNTSPLDIHLEFLQLRHPHRRIASLSNAVSLILLHLEDLHFTHC